MNSDALAYLAGKGLSIDEIIEFARLAERKKDPTNAERQARYRANRKQDKVTRYSNAVTPPIDRTHTPSPDISSDEESQSNERDDCETVVATWNSMAAANELPTCVKLSPARRKACRARLRDDGLDAIQRAIEHVPKSSFLLGQTGNWSGANINFLLRPETVTKILEGQYDDRGKPARAEPASNHEIQNPYARAVLARQAARVGDERERSDSWP